MAIDNAPHSGGYSNTPHSSGSTGSTGADESSAKVESDAPDPWAPVVEAFKNLGK